ncbi:MAG TPA: serine/threonine-protein kinase, partial [Polyangiaceae bacterium]|nr:serine/threonine-protein kinase [Polyangiaceae bacterium]
MSDSLAPGELITPSIRLARLLGRGGMGSVWIADHLRLRTQVVVKFIAAEFVENDEAMARFEREATLAAQAKSPHVVQVFDHGISNGGLPYIAMEYLEGEDLAKRIARRRAIPLALWANWMTQACRGLSRAHAKGIVHRDIKPENIFLCDNEGEVLVKVLDFGIAKTLTAAGGFSGTATGAFLGTPYYMSPEQTMGQKEIDHRTDLWSLGVVAYFALTGVRPFEHEALGAIVAAITTLPIAPPSQHNPTLSPSVDAWMARALARVPDQRFGSAKEMADEFALAIGQAPRESTVSLPAPSWGPAPSTPQKHTTMSSSVQTRTLSGSA